MSARFRDLFAPLIGNLFTVLALVLGGMQVLVGHWVTVVVAGREGPGLALGLVLWRIVRLSAGVDGYRLQSLIILVALLGVPLARIGAAPFCLSRNRHR